MDNNLTELAEMNHRFDVVKSDVKDMSLNKINQQLEWVKPYVWWHEHAHLRIIVILFFLILISIILTYIVNFIFNKNFSFKSSEITIFDFVIIFIIIMIIWIMITMLEPSWYTHRMYANEYKITLENAKEHLMHKK